MFDLNDIVYVKAEGSYSKIVMANGVHKPIVVAFNLKTVSKYLYPPMMKVHRSYVVNINRIKRLLGMTLVVDNGDKIVIGASYKDAVINSLNVVKMSTKEK